MQQSKSYEVGDVNGKREVSIESRFAIELSMGRCEVRQMKNEHASYWILINDQRYCGFETLQDAQFVITYFRASGCEDKLEIEADYEEENAS